MQLVAKFTETYTCEIEFLSNYYEGKKSHHPECHCIIHSLMIDTGDPHPVQASA